MASATSRRAHSSNGIFNALGAIFVLFWCSCGGSLLVSAADGHKHHKRSQAQPEVAGQRQRSKPGIDRLGQALPGPVLDGKLFLLGLQLDSTYDDAAEAFVDVFAMAREVLTVMHDDDHARDLGPDCWAADAADHNIITPELSNLLSFPDAAELPLSCMVHQREGGASPIPMEHVPLESHDGNQGWSTHIWRCNISAVISRERWQHWPSAAVLRVSVLTETGVPVTTVDLPVHHGATAGLYGTRRTPQILPAEKSVTLCTGGINRQGFPFLREFVVHHLQIGVGRIVLGFLALDGDEDMEVARQLLAPWLRTGAVMIVHMQVPGLQWRVPEPFKLHFYHSCLYRAKGTSEFVAFWDIDEYFLPSITIEEAEFDEAALAAALSPLALPDVLRMPGSPNCPDWCYKTFLSYGTFPRIDPYRPDAPPRTNRTWEDFPLRDVMAEDTWKKSVVRSKAAHMGGFHVQGSCLTGLPPPDPKYNHEGANEDCIVEAFDKGAMRHALNLIRFRDPVEAFTVVEDEYAAIFGARVQAARSRLPEVEL